MDFNIGDRVYALKITHDMNDTRIIEGNIFEFKDAIVSDFGFYPFEAIILKFKRSIDSGIPISMRAISSFNKDINDLGVLKYESLKSYIQHLDKVFIEFEDTCSYPIDLVSTERRSLDKYSNFLKDFFNGDINIYKYIEKNFR